MPKDCCKDKMFLYEKETNINHLHFLFRFAGNITTDIPLAHDILLLYTAFLFTS